MLSKKAAHHSTQSDEWTTKGNNKGYLFTFQVSNGGKTQPKSMAPCEIIKFFANKDCKKNCYTRAATVAICQCFGADRLMGSWSGLVSSSAAKQCY